MLENLNAIELLVGGFVALLWVYAISRIATHAYFRSKLDYFRTTTKDLDALVKRGEIDAKE